jgi:hypothetical protein
VFNACLMEGPTTKVGLPPPSISNQRIAIICSGLLITTLVFSKNTNLAPCGLLEPLAYATQIDSDDREPLRQLRHDRAIFEPIFGEPVNQDYARPFAAANVVKRDPIDRRGFGGEFLA